MKKVAAGLASLGRGPDTMLVHMSPGEVGGLQALAKAKGGSLTLNPHTGLPEAGFLSDMLPAIATAAAIYFTGGLAAGAMGAGAAGAGAAGAAGAGALGAGAAGAGAGALGAGALGAEAAGAMLGAGATGAGSAALGGAGMGGMGAGLTAGGYGAGALGAGAAGSAGLGSMLGAGVGGTSAALGGASMGGMGAGLTAGATGAETLGAGAAQGSGLGSMLGGAVDWAKANPMSAGIGAYGALSAMQDTPEFGQPEKQSSNARISKPWQEEIDPTAMGRTDQRIYTGDRYAGSYADGGGIMALAGGGDYAAGGRLLDGPGDGVSDSIPAVIQGKKPQRAALADGEFVVPARIVSELGNGSTKAGAKRLYAMMERVQRSRGKTVGKNKVAVDSKASRHLPA